MKIILLSLLFVPMLQASSAAAVGSNGDYPMTDVSAAPVRGSDKGEKLAAAQLASGNKGAAARFRAAMVPVPSASNGSADSLSDMIYGKMPPLEKDEDPKPSSLHNAPYGNISVFESDRIKYRFGKPADPVGQAVHRSESESKNVHSASLNIPLIPDLNTPRSDSFQWNRYNAWIAQERATNQAMLQDPSLIHSLKIWWGVFYGIFPKNAESQKIINGLEQRYPNLIPKYPHLVPKEPTEVSPDINMVPAESIEYMTWHTYFKTLKPIWSTQPDRPAALPNRFIRGPGR